MSGETTQTNFEGNVRKKRKLVYYGCRRTEDWMMLLPRKRMNRRLNRRDLETLAKGFAMKRTRESGPDKDGVAKHVAKDMIHAAADAAEERMKQKS